MIKQIADKHGLSVARVATETDDYARMVRSTVGAPTLLAMILSYSTSVWLREVFDLVLLANKVNVITGGSSEMKAVNKIFTTLDSLCVNPPKYRFIKSRYGRDFYVIADSGTNLDYAISSALSDPRVIAALAKSAIGEEVNHEIERLKHANLI